MAPPGQGAAATYTHLGDRDPPGTGLGDYEEAFAAARHASEDRHLDVSTWALPELIEAAARSGGTHLAGDALDRLTETAHRRAEPTPAWACRRAAGAAERRRGGRGPVPEAIDRLGRTALRPELARAHLLYGEWLRRERRRGDAREQLRTAHDMLEAMGMEAFAERARRELRATGETARKRTAAARDEELTAQEAQIARLARDGLSNPEIGTRLFISPARSSTTWATSSPSSASPRAASSATSCPSGPVDPGAHRVASPRPCSMTIRASSTREPMLSLRNTWRR